MLNSINAHQMNEDMIGATCFIIRKDSRGVSQMVCTEVIGITSNHTLVFSDPEQPKHMITVSVPQVDQGDVILYSVKDVIASFSASFCVVDQKLLTTD